MRKTGAFLLLLLCLIIASQSLRSQQGNNWYFGGHAGLSFNSSPPVALLNGALDTYEGCASISDNSGQLLFYTDGTNVWNKYHQLMPNGIGLKGDPSSSNSAIIIPKPGSTSIYYIFTADASENNNRKGYNYSEVDMMLDGGLGDITLNKNILLYTPSTEKLTAVRAANGIDIWVITHAWGNNAWYTYKVDCNGVNTLPVQSMAGTSYTETTIYTDLNGTRPVNDGSVGCLKASPDGKKIATARAYRVGWELFNFDNSTGLITNPLLIFNITAYGLEFSPDSKLIYVASEHWGYDSSFITQYNLSTYDSLSIVSSGIKVGSVRVGPVLDHDAIGALQMGPDNKIYCALESDSFLAVINSPNTVGISCNFVDHQLNLQQRICKRGLPVFFPSLVTNNNADFGFTINNNCSTVNFSGVSTIAGNLTWTWDFGDGNTATGQNVTHTYAAGTVTDSVKLTVTTTTSCGTADAVSVKQINLSRITPASKFGFSGKCGNPSISFSDSSTVPSGNIQKWLWDFGDGITSAAQNPVHTYPASANYSVTLTVASEGGCNGTDISQQLVSTSAKPIANFSFSKTCIGAPVAYNDSSTIAAGTVTKWFWSLDDGSTSTVQNPVHLYNKEGDYTIKLATISSTGCRSDTASKTIHVTSNPIVRFTAMDTCFGLSTKFTGTASIKNASISGWWWSLGDGNTEFIQNPVHAYATAGKYTIRMSATANSGCSSDTLSRTLTIGAKPIADFSFTNACGDLKIPFTDQSPANTEPITQWSWSFGDGNNASIKTPQNVYANYGDYPVTLLVKSSLGCSSDTTIKAISLNAKPVANFGAKGACENQTTRFIDSSSIAAGAIALWNWDLGNAITSNQQAPSLNYPAYGNYTVTLVITSDKNCISDPVTKILAIETKPLADFSVDNGCTGHPLHLQNKSSIQFGALQTYQWYWGDGNTSSQQQPDFAYAGYGDFTIKQVAVSKNGCISDTAYQTVNIETIPNVDFNFASVCADKPIPFLNLSTNQYGPLTSLQWNFGNGDGSSLFNPVYTYRQYGNYVVSLTATTKNGCESTLSKALAIRKVTVFAGNDTIVAVSQPLQLQATGAKDYIWSPSNYLDDPLSDHPMAILPASQTYYLSGITAEGCSGYDTIHIKVYKGPDIYVPNAFTPNGDGLNDVFRPILPGVKELLYFSVYNRWGQLVFTTKEIGNGWDGRINGVIQEAGTFVWVLKVKTFEGNTIDKNGPLLLIR